MNATSSRRRWSTETVLVSWIGEGLWLCIRVLLYLGTVPPQNVEVEKSVKLEVFRQSWVMEYIDSDEISHTSVVARQILVGW